MRATPISATDGPTGWTGHWRPLLILRWYPFYFWK